MIEISYIIVALVVIFLLYLLLDLLVGLSSFVDLLRLRFKKRTIKSNTSQVASDMFFSEDLVGTTGIIVQKLDPYGKVEINKKIYDAMCISGKSTSGKVLVQKIGKTCLLVKKID